LNVGCREVTVEVESGAISLGGGAGVISGGAVGVRSGGAVG
jgi:hypothetical protein